MKADSRQKGHRLERSDAQLLKTLFPFAVTARFGSKQQDDAGIDIINTPFAWQCKAGYPKGINYAKLIDDITKKQKSLKEVLPVIIHHNKLTRKSEDNRIVMLKTLYMKMFSECTKDVCLTFKKDLVILSFSQFIDVLTCTYKS